MDKKEAIILDFTKSLIEASLINIAHARNILELKIARSEVKSVPCNEVFFDFITLFTLNSHVLKNNYPELTCLKKGDLLPKQIGQYHLNPIATLSNRRFYISPLVKKCEEAGFAKIYVDCHGIYFYLHKKDLGPLASAYFGLCDQVVNACVITLNTAKQYLDTWMQREKKLHRNIGEIYIPTHGVFVSYPELLAGKTSYPEFSQMVFNSSCIDNHSVSSNDNRCVSVKNCLYVKSDCEHLDNNNVVSLLPPKIGHFDLDVRKIFENEEYFISKIVRQLKDNGLEGANISSEGITYYLPPDQLPHPIKTLYEKFFLSKQTIEHLKQKAIDTDAYQMDHFLIITYPMNYTQNQLVRINYELRKHYNKLGYSVNLSYDWRYEKLHEKLVMKIYIDAENSCPSELQSDYETGTGTETDTGFCQNIGRNRDGNGRNKDEYGDGEKCGILKKEEKSSPIFVEKSQRNGQNQYSKPFKHSTWNVKNSNWRAPVDNNRGDVRFPTQSKFSDFKK